MSSPQDSMPHQADKLLQRPEPQPTSSGSSAATVTIPRPPEGQRHPGAQAPTPRSSIPWIAVSGGKGGVGKTTISVNLAVLLQRAGHRVLLVDLDPGLPNVDVQLRLPAPYTLEDVAMGHVDGETALREGPHGLRVLAGRSGSDWLASGGESAAQQALRTIESCATGFDVVLVDTGAGIGPTVMAAAARADLVLGVTTPDPASITDAYALCKVLHRAGHPLPHMIINHAKNRDHALVTVARLGRVTEQFLGVSVPHAGWLRRDGLVERSTVDQRAVALHGTGPVMEDLRALTAGTLAALPKLPRRSGRQGTHNKTVNNSNRAVAMQATNSARETLQASRKAEAARRLLRRREPS